jgi:uncharacterized membrane protein YfcA
MFDFLAVPIKPGQLAFLVVSALVAGLARGFSGFGAALIFVPLGSVVLGPTMAAPLLLAVDYVTSMGLIPRAVRLADRPSVLMTLIGALVGIPLGVYLLASYDPLLIRWAIVALVAMMLVLLISGWRYPGRPSSTAAVMVGGVAGVLTGVSQMSGPPLVAFWLSGTTTVNVVRANIIFFYAFATLVSAASYYWWGLLSFDIVRYALILAVPYGFGLWLGARMFGMASELTFRRVCYVMIAAAGIVSVPALDGVIR